MGLQGQLLRLTIRETASTMSAMLALFWPLWGPLTIRGGPWSLPEAPSPLTDENMGSINTHSSVGIKSLTPLGSQIPTKCHSDAQNPRTLSCLL